MVSWERSGPWKLSDWINGIPAYYILISLHPIQADRLLSSLYYYPNNMVVLANQFWTGLDSRVTFNNSAAGNLDSWRSGTFWIFYVSTLSSRSTTHIGIEHHCDLKRKRHDFCQPLKHFLGSGKCAHLSVESIKSSKIAPLLLFRVSPTPLDFKSPSLDCTRATKTKSILRGLIFF